jgi:lipoyltransferase/lipoate-protein ligase
MAMIIKQAKNAGLELFDEEPTLNPAENMARERFLWKSVISPFARVWVNDPCVVLGRFLNAEDEVNMERASALCIPILWRPSGGGAVFHDHGNINYSLYLPNDGTALKMEDSLRSLSYPVIRLLDSLGIPWEWVPPNNIYVKGKKISGSAQARSRGRLLHHGTLLVQCDLGLMQSLLKPGGKSCVAPVINLSELAYEMTTGIAEAAMKNILWSVPQPIRGNHQDPARRYMPCQEFYEDIMPLLMKCK